MSWRAATARSAIIVGYFAIASLWLPSTLLKLGAVASAAPGVRDFVALATWGLGITAGIVGLRVGQRRGWL